MQVCYMVLSSSCIAQVTIHHDRYVPDPITASASKAAARKVGTHTSLDVHTRRVYIAQLLQLVCMLGQLQCWLRPYRVLADVQYRFS